MWGRIARAHGDNGVVIARFAKNLPPRAMGATLRVMLYPNRAWFYDKIEIFKRFFIFDHLTSVYSS